MKRPADIYLPSLRIYSEQIPDITYPKHDIIKGVSNCGRVHLFGRKHNFQLGSALAGQNVGLREISPGRWLVTFMNLDLGYVDEKTTDRPLKCVTYVFGKICYLSFNLHIR